MRFVVEEHPLDDFASLTDLADHLHQVHHISRHHLRSITLERLELLHADDHDDLRRGCG